MNDQEKKELQSQLDELKSSLEKAVSEKVKKELESQIKSLEEKLNSIDFKAVNENVEGIKKDITSIKEAGVKRDEADKENQKAIDQLLADVKGIRKNSNPKTEGQKNIADLINDALNEENSVNKRSNADLVEMMARNHKDRVKRFSFDIGQKAADVISTGNVTGGSRYGQVFAPGIIEPPKRKVHVRQLVPIGNAGPGNTYTFMYESGGEGAPATTAQDGAKPLFDMDLVEKTVNFEVIAGRVKVTRKAMNNIPGFLSYLNSRLPEKLLRAEDAQLINGDGNTPNISGIMDAGNYTAATSGSDILIEQLIDSIAQLEDEEERNATGILLRPVDYYGFFKNKATGSGEYDLPQNVTFVNGVLYISGVPVFTSTANISGKYIVGDWEMGAQLLIQEGQRIEFFEQDEDNVKYNRITVRIEETVAFPIYGDNYFIVGDVPAS